MAADKTLLESQNDACKHILMDRTASISVKTKHLKRKLLCHLFPHSTCSKLYCWGVEVRWWKTKLPLSTECESSSLFALILVGSNKAWKEGEMGSPPHSTSDCATSGMSLSKELFLHPLIGESDAVPHVGSVG